MLTKAHTHTYAHSHARMHAHIHTCTQIISVFEVTYQDLPTSKYSFTYASKIPFRFRFGLSQCKVHITSMIFWNVSLFQHASSDCSSLNYNNREKSSNNNKYKRRPNQKSQRCVCVCDLPLCAFSFFLRMFQFFTYNIFNDYIHR